MTVAEGRLAGVTRTCPLGDAWFAERAADGRPIARVEGRDASLDEAAEAAAEILRQARAPLVYGLGQTSCEAQRQAVATREKEVAQRETYRASLEKARDDMKHLAADILSTRQRRMIGVQFEVTKLAREFGISSDRVVYENPDSEDGALERFGIVVPLAGGYSNLRKFIQAVESSDNFLVIERVTLGTGKSTEIVELNITLATYFIAPDAKLDQLGKPVAAPSRSS
jgi:Tfp pilus assembly protein PilO